MSSNRAKFTITNKEEFPINRNVTLESVLKNFVKNFLKIHKIKIDGEWNRISCHMITK
jgi:hypothetical protein